MSNMIWEYKVERRPWYETEWVYPNSTWEEDYLNNIGKEGWELCGSPVTDSMGSSWIYFWKRHISE